MYEIMSDLGKYLVNRYALCLKGSNMPRPPLQHARHSVGPIIVPSEYSTHQCCCVPRWYSSGPPSPDAGQALHQ